jgi:alkyldihydroxyacetonephosphate synthase
VQHMKWWGWGDEDVTFTHDDKPKLAPFVKENIGLDLDAGSPLIMDFDALEIADSVVTADLRGRLVSALGADHVDDSAMERVVHTYGKSLRDLVRIRAGDLGRLPDLVLYPGSEDEVAAVLDAAFEHDAVVIPFGGGTNISGSLEAPRAETRTVLSLDMGRMDQLLEIDETSQIARVQAGVLGPDLERQLNGRGWTIGHFPDSFSFSTLGGWIATRSSGMQSDKYGDIADLTRGLRVVTPAGLLEVRPVPTTSTGPSVREMVLGSEGRLGVITEATIHVHRVPDQRTILGYLFPDWKRGMAAMHEIAASDAAPSVTRISDARETQFSFATKKPGGTVDTATSAVMQRFLQYGKKFDLEQMCLSFIGYEGTEAHVKTQKKLVGKIVSKHGGIGVGSGPGEMYDQKKFDTPYIRDFLLDRGGLADVSETSAPWSKIVPLYERTIAEANRAFDRIGVRGWVMCHLSHSYHSGACLYFTFAFEQREGMDPLDQYDIVKSAIQQSFIDSGGTLSHHHAVGLEHQPWLEQDISAAGVSILTTLFDGVDPGGHLNPGKVVGGGADMPRPPAGTGPVVDLSGDDESSQHAAG